MPPRVSSFSAPRPPFFILVSDSRAESLETTFPRFPCHPASCWALPVGGTSSKLKGGGKGDVIFPLSRVPVAMVAPAAGWQLWLLGFRSDSSVLQQQLLWLGQPKRRVQHVLLWLLQAYEGSGFLQLLIFG